MPTLAAQASTLLTLIAALSATAAQSVTSTPPSPARPAVFDIVAIKPSDPSIRGDCYMKGQLGGQTFVGRCVPLRLIVKYAYKIIDSQITGGPGWMDTELYDFEAKTDRPVTRAEVAALFQGLLADRFQLQFHREARTMPALILTVDKSGSKMKPNETSYEWDIPITLIPGATPKFRGARCPMYYLSWWIAQQKNRPVLDKTNLPGFWDFTLQFTPDGMGEGRKGPNGDLDVPISGSALPTALREQLGLRLDSEKAPVDVYVIDHVERASAN